MTQTNKTALLWWIAFVAESIAAVLETIDKDFTKAAGLYCLSLAFLILALSKGSDQPLWRKFLLLFLGLAAIAIFVYRFVIMRSW